jgi:hypothetical protein
MAETYIITAEKETLCRQERILYILIKSQTDDFRNVRGAGLDPMF